MKKLLPALLALTPLLLAGDCTSPTVDDDDTTEQQSDWAVMDEGLPGALISIWGSSSSDVWVAGAHEPTDQVADDDDSVEQRGPGIARRWDGTSWTDLEPPTDRDLWWVFSDGGDEVFYVGEDSTILRYDRTDSSWTALDSPIGPGTTLFGAWGPQGGPGFAVGGNVNSMEEGGVLLRIDGDTVTEVVDPILEVSAMESFFKCWGTSEDDLWVITDRGTLFHWDGATWSKVVMPGNPRLVTINGGQPDAVVIVGGETQAVIYEYDGVAWNDAAPPGGSSLNGIFVDEAGNAWAAGSSNAVARRAEGGWVWELPPLVLIDWHAVWLDETGTPWLAGGNLIELIDGAVVRYDPAGG